MDVEVIRCQDVAAKVFCTLYLTFNYSKSSRYVSWVSCYLSCGNQECSDKTLVKPMQYFKILQSGSNTSLRHTLTNMAMLSPGISVSHDLKGPWISAGVHLILKQASKLL